MKYLYVLFFLLPLSSYSQIITTYVGNGTMGLSGDGGAATSARLTNPVGLNFDTKGNLLLCQSDLVRKVDLSTKVIHSIAGDTLAGAIGDSGPATSAMVNMPTSVCVDGTGNYYIADYWTGTIRKVDAVTGNINVFVGTTFTTGSSGDGGPATASKIGGAGTVCIDAVRNILYFTDEWNHKIRKVDLKTDTITTFAGTGVSGFSGDGGKADTAKLSRVMGLCLDSAGNVFVGDWDNARIRRIDVATGIITTIAGNGSSGYGGDGGPALSAMLTRAVALSFDHCGNLYFADDFVNRVRRIDALTGTITTVAGNGVKGYSGDDSVATRAKLNGPDGIAIDNDGDIYVSDYYNHRVRKISGLDTNCHNSNPSLNVNVNTPNFKNQVYPNPASDLVHLDGLPTQVRYKLLSMVGTVMQTGELSSGSNSIPLKGLASGVYVLEVYDNETGGRVVSRIIKQ